VRGFTVALSQMGPVAMGCWQRSVSQ